MAKLACLTISNSTGCARIFHVSSEKMMLGMAPFITLEKGNVFVLDKCRWFVSVSFKVQVLNSHAFGLSFCFLCFRFQIKVIG